VIDGQAFGLGKTDEAPRPGPTEEPLESLADALVGPDVPDIGHLKLRKLLDLDFESVLA